MRILLLRNAWRSRSTYYDYTYARLARTLMRVALRAGRIEANVGTTTTTSQVKTAA